jgi:asparagine synthase (glutamine-hydrolysing)
MNPFLVVVDLDGASLGLDALTPGLPALTQSDGRVEVLWNRSWAGAWVPSRQFARPAFVHQRGVFAIGNVRLTGRRDRRSDLDPAAADLAHVVAQYFSAGPLAIRSLVGDFAFVLWDSREGRLTAARDALGVKSLYWHRRGSRLTLASHLDCFEQVGYDREFISEFLVGLPAATTRTVYPGVSRLAAGHLLVAQGNQAATEPYWDAADFMGRNEGIEPGEAVGEFRRLFGEAVAAQLDDRSPAWSQLSGGLDSSSVVGMAARLAAEGRVPPLRGSVTVVDSLSEGDETRYSDAVIAAHPLANVQLRDYGAWQQDEVGPPMFAEPRVFLPFFARDRAMCRTVIDDGATVMLSGFGSDSYLAGPHSYLADLVARGRFAEAARCLVDLAVVSRRSVYEMAFENVMVPLGPRWLRRWRPSPVAQVPRWIDPDFARWGRLPERMAGSGPSAGRGIFEGQLATELGTIDLALERGVFDEGLEVRYPFLHRPLVEFAISLPIAMRVRPGRQKWILREALGDLLPPVVRERRGKGGIDGRIVWSLSKERSLLDRLVADSRLVELGCVDRAALASALAAARAGDIWSVGPLFATLALETWLAVRSGRWSRAVFGGPAAESAGNNSLGEGADHVVH